MNKHDQHILMPWEDDREGMGAAVWGLLGVAVGVVLTCLWLREMVVGICN